MDKRLRILIALLIIMTAAAAATCQLFDTFTAELIIDWVAFIAGIFLVAEGLYKIFSSKNPLLRDQILRAIRVLIGTCVFTIHLLQFMRF
jgi:hypothetical protein